ncbi:MAG: hypothetical protein V1848_03390 [Candidatus Magasanikbacteria bacterium]
MAKNITKGITNDELPCLYQEGNLAEDECLITAQDLLATRAVNMRLLPDADELFVAKVAMAGGLTLEELNNQVEAKKAEIKKESEQATRAPDRSQMRTIEQIHTSAPAVRGQAIARAKDKTNRKKDEKEEKPKKVVKKSAT